MTLKTIPLRAFGSRVTLQELVASPTPVLTLERRADGRLWAANGGEPKPVTAHRCFPWSAPTQFVSLRSDDGTEIGLVQDVNTLSPTMRAALMDELAVAGFVLSIQRVLDIDEEIEVRTWRVITTQGPRTLQTGRDEWPRELPGGGIVVKDVAGDLYHVGNVSLLDTKSRKLLWALVD